MSTFPIHRLKLTLAWHVPAMICCKSNTVCPKCQHQFPVQWTTSRRGGHDMNGGVHFDTTSISPLHSPEASTDPVALTFFISLPPSNVGQLQQVHVPQMQVVPPQQVPHVVHHHHHHHHQHQPQLQQEPFAQHPPAEVQHHQPIDPPLAPSPDIVRALRLSGWYYEGITYLDSQELLKDKQLGTFIVRESFDPRFLFSLSVQTERGPTSVRIHYVNGLFCLDSQEHIQSTMPSFPTVIELIQHYVDLSNKSKTTPHVWVDPKGKMYSPITIVRPLMKDSQKPSSLKHLARLAVNAAVQESIATKRDKTAMPTIISQLELPASVSQYLTEYPYSI